MKPSIKITRDQLGRYEISYNDELIMCRLATFPINTMHTILKMLKDDSAINYKIEEIIYELNDPAEFI